LRRTINNNGWQSARRCVGLVQVRVHDLKHTYGRRLRAAGVPLKTRRVLLGHKNGDIFGNDFVEEKSGHRIGPLTA